MFKMSDVVVCVCVCVGTCGVVSLADSAKLEARECGGDGILWELHADAGKEPDLAGAKSKTQGKTANHQLNPDAARLLCRQWLARNGKTAPDRHIQA